MKKTLTYLVRTVITIMTAVSVLFSCSKSEIDSEKTMRVSFEVNAMDDSRSVASSGEYINHYVMGVYMIEDNTINTTPYAMIEKDVTTGTLSCTISVDLMINQSYEIIVWADTRGKYDVSDFTAIRRTATVNNDLSLDAFVGKIHYIADGNNLPGVIEARRPFAQVVVVSEDLVTANVPKVKVKYKAPSSFNALTDMPGDTVLYETDFIDVFDTGQKILTMDYIFVRPDTEDFLESYEISSRFSDSSVIQKIIYQLPVRRNFCTNVSGNFLTE